MKILAIDTSNSSGSIALQIDNELVFSSYFSIKITHSETLMPEIARALALTKTAIKDLDAIAIAIGPGSFTGLRIGLATAKGICFANNIPLIPISSLKVQAMSFYNCNRNILVIQDAKMKEVYASLYTSELEELIPPTCLKPDAIGQFTNSDALVCGTGVAKYGELLAQYTNLKINMLEIKNSPKAEFIFSILKIEDINASFNFEEVSRIEPYYIRKSQAEENLNKKQNGRA